VTFEGHSNVYGEIDKLIVRRSNAYALASLAIFSRMESKNLTYSHPQFQNVTPVVECSALVGPTSLNLVSNFMVERGGKRK